MGSRWRFVLRNPLSLCGRVLCPGTRLRSRNNREHHTEQLRGGHWALHFSSAGRTMIFSRRMKRQELHRIVPAPAVITGRGENGDAAQRTRRLDSAGGALTASQRAVHAAASQEKAIRMTLGFLQNMAEAEAAKYSDPGARPQLRRHTLQPQRGEAFASTAQVWGQIAEGRLPIGVFCTNHLRKRNRNSKHCQRTRHLMHTGHSGLTACGIFPVSSSAYTAQSRGIMHQCHSPRCDANWFLNKQSAENRRESFGTWETTRNNTCKLVTGSQH